MTNASEVASAMIPATIFVTDLHNLPLASPAAMEDAFPHPFEDYPGLIESRFSSATHKSERSVIRTDGTGVHRCIKHLEPCCTGSFMDGDCALYVNSGGIGSTAFHDLPRPPL